MLLRFSVANYRSFWREQQLSMIASSLKDDASGLIESPALRGEKLLPSAVVYGANASGKSNLLRAMAFMQSTIVNSHSRGGPETKIERNRFTLDPGSVGAPSRFSVEFLHEGVRYEYGFEALDDHFEKEWLHWWPSGVRSYLFDRAQQEFRFGHTFKGRKQLLAGLTRPNSLFFSVAVQNNHAELNNIYKFLESMLFRMNDLQNLPLISPAIPNAAYALKVTSLLHAVGTGISSVQSSYQELSKSQIALLRAIDAQDEAETGRNPTLTGQIFRFGHKNSEGDIVFMDFVDESDGTRWLADRLGPIFAALDQGALIAIDEFGANVHTLAADAILGLFASKETNPKGAQLIVATHDTNLLSSRHIRRDQIWFTEKDKGATMLTPLTDIRTRKGDDIEKGYLQGRFGAIPFAHFDPSILEAD